MKTDPRGPLDEQKCPHSRNNQNDADYEEGDDALYGDVGQPFQCKCLRESLFPEISSAN